VGDRAERIVEQRLRAALPDGARLYANVPILAKTRTSGPGHDGEADIVIVDPEHGLLVIETKSGEPRRDAHNRWFIGGHELPRSPFEQAMAAKHDLATMIEAFPGWPRDGRLPTAHAVAFPDVDLASLPPDHALLGPDATADIVLDADAFATPGATRRSLERAWAWWEGDGTRGHRLAAAELALVDELLAPTLELHRLLRHDVKEGSDRLVRASNAQRLVLNVARSQRRVEVVGPAGSGKSLVAVEKARRLSREGWRTLFVCFNQALATAVLREVEEEVEDDEEEGGGRDDLRPTVSTFHRLAETLAASAGLLRAKPADPGPEWFDGLAANLVPAISALPAERYEAIVVDEGQDFAADWLVGLELLLRNPDDGILWVFHDPGQALFRDDVVADLGLERLELFEDYRSPAPVAELAGRFYQGPGTPVPMAEEGRTPEVIEAAAGADTVEAVRRTLHHVLVEEDVRPWHVAVLSGQTASKSDVWHQRRYGNVELWNGAIDDDGRSLGLPGELVPEEPKDDGVVLFETVRRFKGLERPVVILCELPDEGDRLDQLLYTALTRATAHLVVIAPATLARRLRTAGRGRPTTSRSARDSRADTAMPDGGNQMKNASRGGVA
jgi:UvrD-like helicase family protein/nuclease-like protein/type III restriction/modification enzyme restriction subunit